MKTLTVTLKIVTPMFLGGAEHEATSIRPPSVKGVLRFWWRAMNWGRFCNGCTEADALKELHKEEARLFGHAVDNKSGGQGCFLLTIENANLTSQSPPNVHQEFATKPAARYLGYGLMVAFGKHGGRLDRSCLNADQTFTAKLLFKDKVDSSIVEAIKAIGLLGGLGSRTRRGMGSIALESLKLDDKEQWERPTDIKSYRERIKDLFTSIKFSAVEPPFTAFWENSRIDLLLSNTDQYSVLNEYGKAMLMYRSWGRSNSGGGSTVLYEPSEQRFKDDHHWCKGLLTALKPNFHPERVEFGLPHNYDRQALSEVKAENHERRASPLFFHVHQFADNSFVGVSIYLPAKFLPDGEKIKAGVKDVPANIEWSVITNFLDGQVGNPPTADKRFPAKEAVLP